MQVIPIRVVSSKKEAPLCFPFPEEMLVFHAPNPPSDADHATLLAAADCLEHFLFQLKEAGFSKVASLDLLSLPNTLRDTLTHALGFGEISAYTTAPAFWRLQETAFAGIWRVVKISEGGQILSDFLQSGTIPLVLVESMQKTTAFTLPPPVFLAETMNAPALVHEILAKAKNNPRGQTADIINLTLLPLNDADIDCLYAWLGHEAVAILSRGYGNCRISSTRLQSVWWVQYFNSMDKLILNTIEIVDMPSAALAAQEDFDDSLERLESYIDSLRLSAKESD